MNVMKRRMDVYESLESFVCDYTKGVIVQLENYKKIFAYQMLLLTGLLMMKLVTKLVMKLMRVVVTKKFFGRLTNFNFFFNKLKFHK